MSINKFLCKHFDPFNHGYVTIIDIVAAISMYLFAGLMTSLVFVVIGTRIYPGASDIMNPSAQYVVILWMTGLAVVCVAICGVTIMTIILTHKVAECPRKPN